MDPAVPSDDPVSVHRFEPRTPRRTKHRRLNNKSLFGVVIPAQEEGGGTMSKRVPSLPVVLVACVLALVALLALSSPVMAQTNIPIVRPSFEAPVVGDGNWTTGATGWTVSPTSGGGVFDPLIPTHIDSVPWGNQTLWINGPAEVSQNLGVYALPDTTYELTVRVGARYDLALPTDIGIEVRTASGPLPLVTFTTPTPSDG
jgi:hypothetical protein